MEDRFDAFRWLENYRWSGRPTCPEGCGEDEIAPLRRKMVSDQLRTLPDKPRLSNWKCRICGKQFSSTSGSVFHRVQQLEKWVAALRIIASEPKISQRELARRLDVRRKTAAEMKNRLSSALESGHGEVGGG